MLCDSFCCLRCLPLLLPSIWGGAIIHGCVCCVPLLKKLPRGTALLSHAHAHQGKESKQGGGLAYPAQTPTHPKKETRPHKLSARTHSCRHFGLFCYPTVTCMSVWGGLGRSIKLSLGVGVINRT